MEPLSTILPFSVIDPLLELPNFSRNGTFVLGPASRVKIKVMLNLTTCTFKCATSETSNKDFSFFGESHFPSFPKFLPKLINWSRNTLRRKEKVLTEAYNLYFQVRFIWNFYQRF